MTWKGLIPTNQPLYINMYIFLHSFFWRDVFDIQSDRIRWRSLWDPKFKTFLNRYGYMLNNNNNNNNNNVWTRRLAVTCSQEKKDNNFFNSVKWMIVNVTKLVPVSPENTLVLDQLSEEGFDLWPLVTSCFELRDSPFPKKNVQLNSGLRTSNMVKGL